jgi:hypothetical protein
MGLFFSDDTSTTNSTTNQYDQRRIIGAGAINADAGGSVIVNTTDGGAIQGAINLADRLTLGAFSLSDSLGTNAFNLSDRATSGAYQLSDRMAAQVRGVADTAMANVADAYRTSGSQIFNTSKTAISSVAEAFNSSGKMVSEAYAESKGRGAMTDKILIGALIMAGLVAIAALRSK